VNGVVLVAAGSVGLGVAAVTAIACPPTRRLGARVRPYTVVARAALGHPPDVVPTRGAEAAGTYGRMFGPPLRALAGRVVGHAGRNAEDRLARLLLQAGEVSTSADDFRLRQLAQGALLALVAGVSVAVLTHAPVAVLVSVVAGYVVGSTRTRKRLERAVDERAARIRQELYTVNHLLAMHVRTGSGPIQATQRVVDRGRGVVVEELAGVLSTIRNGVYEGDAFRRAAQLTPEPGAARTYQLLAASAERGADLGTALLSLSEDLRDARREQLHKDAVRRRAAMLVPTIAILAPIMLLFIAAPLPSVVLGNR
jgi:Flp pilus assembly protein TadB